MPTVHPSSIVDPAAQIADDVIIGPNCIIQGDVRIGAGTRLIAAVHLQGPVQLGHHNVLYPQVCIGFEPQAHWYKGGTAGVHIGDHNTFREGTSIHCSGGPDHATEIGSHNLFMTTSHAGHDCRVGNHCTFASGALLGGHAEVHDRANIGGHGAVHQFARVGAMAFVGGASGIVGDLPPYCVASGINQVTGLNLVGLRRSGASHEAIDRLKHAYQALYLDRHTRPVAIALIQDMLDRTGPGDDLLAVFLNFVRGSKRALIPHAASATGRRLQR